MQWFVTAQQAGRRVVDEVEVAWPSSVAHASTVDAALTACGRRVEGWEPMQHLSFPVLGAMTCPVCLRTVAIARAELAQSGYGPGIFADAV